MCDVANAWVTSQSKIVIIGSLNNDDGNAEDNAY